MVIEGREDEVWGESRRGGARRLEDKVVVATLTWLVRRSDGGLERGDAVDLESRQIRTGR